MTHRKSDVDDDSVHYTTNSGWDRSVVVVVATPSDGIECLRALSDKPVFAFRFPLNRRFHRICHKGKRKCHRQIQYSCRVMRRWCVPVFKFSVVPLINATINTVHCRLHTHYVHNKHVPRQISTPWSCFQYGMKQYELGSAETIITRRTESKSIYISAIFSRLLCCAKDKKLGLRLNEIV